MIKFTQDNPKMRKYDTEKHKDTLQLQEKPKILLQNYTTKHKKMIKFTQDIPKTRK